jgi:DNA polymerase-3 subunit beta
MKISITKEQLSNGLQAVQNVVATRTTLPVLSNVLLRAQGDRLELTATDLDISVTTAVPATVKKPGATTLPAKKFFGIIRELGPQDIDLDTDDKNHTTIQSGSSYYKINGLGADEFPAEQPIAESRTINLPQEKFKGLLRKTSFAISTDETRFVLNGILLSLKEHNVTMVATDGRRLALAYEEVDVPGTSQGECIVPTKAINELNRLLSAKGDIEVKIGPNKVSFALSAEGANPVTIVSKLIEGNYPNYKQVIPGETKERVTLNRDEFHAALRRAELMTSEKSHSVKLTFRKNSLEITANTPEVGEARESIAVNYKGPDMAIAFNPGYLMDPLKALADDEVYLELIDDLSPGIVKTHAPFLYVIMPMRMS